jgi:plastocyanin
MSARPKSRWGALLLLALALGLVAASPAAAANRRVAIGDYRWSLPEVSINLGEHVTWHFVGPDSSHSVTGISDNAKGLDSDPQTRLPHHQLGDTFRLTFNEPGVYEFQCKLHSAVRGTVTVSDTPGDPNTEADPVPPPNVDLIGPTLNEVRLGRTRFGARGGTVLHLALDESALIEAEYYLLRPNGRKRYVGYADWNGHVGYNDFHFGTPREHFKAPPGRYMALLSATDASVNRSRFHRVWFRLAG